MLKNYFSSNLKYLRENKSMSQNRLSQLTNVSQATINRWEAEENVPTLDNVIDIAEVFNISLGDLLGKDLRTNNPPNENNHEEYKNILKEKGLMDENEIINKESLDKLMKIADIIEGMNKKED